MHQNAEIFAIQIPCDADTGRIATGYALSAFVFGVARTARAVRTALIVAFGDFDRLQPQAVGARTLRVQLVAVAVDEHRARLCMACAGLRVLFHLTISVETLDDVRAAAHTVVRNAVDGRPNGEVEHNHLAEIARSLRSDAIARLFAGEEEAALAARIPDACR